MWKHNKSELQTGLIYLLGTCISTKQLLVGWLVYHLKFSGFVSVHLSSQEIVSESLQSHPNSLPVSSSLYSTFTLSATHHRTLLSPTLLLRHQTPITTHSTPTMIPALSVHTKALLFHHAEMMHDSGAVATQPQLQHAWKRFVSLEVGGVSCPSMIVVGGCWTYPKSPGQL